MKWVVTLGIVLFVAFLAYRTMAPVQVQCEVCMRFEDQLVCRRGAGATEEEARRAAQESACGGNASGMSELIACRSAVPVSVDCSGA